MLTVDDSEYWSKLIKQVSGCALRLREQACADWKVSTCHHLFLLRNEHRRLNMLWTIFVVLLILRLPGFSLHVGGGLIYLLLVAAAVVLIFNLVSRRQSPGGFYERLSADTF